MTERDRRDLLEELNELKDKQFTAVSEEDMHHVQEVHERIEKIKHLLEEDNV